MIPQEQRLLAALDVLLGSCSNERVTMDRPTGLVSISASSETKPDDQAYLLLGGSRSGSGDLNRSHSRRRSASATATRKSEVVDPHIVVLTLVVDLELNAVEFVRCDATRMRRTPTPL